MIAAAGRRRPLIAGALAAAAGAVLTLIAGTRPGAPLARPGEPQWILAAPRPLVQRLQLVGTIEPGEVVSLTAPFDATIRDKLVEPGSRVQRGQALLVLDTTEIELQLRDAEAVVLKAGQAFDTLKAWDSSPEVVTARHGVLAAQASVDDLQRKERETKALLDRGIVARMEYDGVAEQLRTQQLQLAAARQSLTATLDRGSSSHRAVAALELETARKKAAELKRQMDGGLVEAPASGLVLRPSPSQTGNGPAQPVEVGARVARAQPLFTIANTDTLMVVARVDEMDVNRIEEGQSVEITADALGPAPLVGRVTRISAQAASGTEAGGGRGAAFDVAAAVELPSPEQRRRIRVGMTATLAIVTYANPAAIVLPPPAVRSGPAGPYALVRRTPADPPREVPLRIGQATEDGVEVLDGLIDGEEVLLDSMPDAAPMAAQPMAAGPPKSL